MSQEETLGATQVQYGTSVSVRRVAASCSSLPLPAARRSFSKASGHLSRMALSVPRLDHSVAIVLVVWMLPHALLRGLLVCDDKAAPHRTARGKWTGIFVSLGRRPLRIAGRERARTSEWAEGLCEAVSSRSCHSNRRCLPERLPLPNQQEAAPAVPPVRSTSGAVLAPDRVQCISRRQSWDGPSPISFCRPQDHQRSAAA